MYVCGKPHPDSCVCGSVDCILSIPQGYYLSYDYIYIYTKQCVGFDASNDSHPTVNNVHALLAVHKGLEYAAALRTMS